jgi:hypothetical protein
MFGITPAPDGNARRIAAPADAADKMEDENFVELWSDCEIEAKFPWQVHASAGCSAYLNARVIDCRLLRVMACI